MSQDRADIYNTPVWIEVSDYSDPCPRFGGAEFNDCLLSYSSDLNFLGSYGEINASPQLGSVKLINLTVINPNPSVTLNVTDGGGSPDNPCVFDYKKYHFASFSDRHTDSSEQDYRVFRTKLRSGIYPQAENKSFPVAVPYSIDGTAVHGEDFSLLNGFIIIPSDQDARSDTIFVLSDNSAEGAKSIVAAVRTSTLFSSSSLPLFIFVYDCITE